MKKFNQFILLVIPIALLISVSCSQPLVVVEPSCIDQVDATVDLEAFYLGNCSNSASFESLQDMVIEISVDGITFDAAGQTANLKYLSNYRFKSDNKNDFGPTTFYKIKLPRCGSYSISVVARGTDNSCFKCCGNFGSATPCPVPSGQIDGKGQIRFRAVSTQINSSIQNPPPPNTRIGPVKENCNCGC